MVTQLKLNNLDLGRPLDTNNSTWNYYSEIKQQTKNLLNEISSNLLLSCIKTRQLYYAKLFWALLGSTESVRWGILLLRDRVTALWRGILSTCSHIWWGIPWCSSWSRDLNNGMAQLLRYQIEKITKQKKISWGWIVPSSLRRANCGVSRQPSCQ